MKYDKTHAQGMREANKRLAEIFTNLKSFLDERIGEKLTKNDINLFVRNEIHRLGTTSLFLGHDAGAGPFPKESCICLNNEIVHGIPDNTHVKKEDLLTVDIGIRYNGYCADAARTYSFTDNAKHKRLMQATEEAFFRACDVIKAGVDIYTIGEVIQKTARKYHANVVSDLVSHGIGKSMWEPPHIFQFPHEHRTLPEYKTVALEPIFSLGSPEIRTLKDRWTLVTKDGSLAAQYENTILVTKDGCEVLTIGE